MGALFSRIPDWLAGTPGATAGLDEARPQPFFSESARAVGKRRLVSCLAGSRVVAVPKSPPPLPGSPQRE